MCWLKAQVCADKFRIEEVGGKGADQQGYCLFVSRVILGDPFMAEGPMKTHKRPPLVDGHVVCC